MSTLEDYMGDKFGLSDPTKYTCIKCYRVFLDNILIAVVPAGMLDGFLSCVFKANPNTRVSLSYYSD